MKIELETVTPSKAQQWLSKQMDNRNVRWPQVKQWSEDMKRGEFPAIAQPLMFDTLGRLIDGQHRLHAVIAADRPVSMFVARDVPPEHRRYIDGGIPRSAADVLHMEYGVASRNHVVALAVLLSQYRLYPDKAWTQAHRPSKQAIVDDVIKNQDEYEHATRLGDQATRTTPSGLWLTRTGYAALAVLVQRDSDFADLWDTFHEGVSTGAGLTRGDSRLALRSASAPNRRYKPQWALLACIKSWNAYAADESLAKIYTGSAVYLPMPEVK